MTQGQTECLKLTSVFAASDPDVLGILQEPTSFPTGGSVQPRPPVTKASRLSLDICPMEMSSAQLSSVTQSCPALCDPMDCSMPGLPVHHQLLELAETHVHQVGDATQPVHMFTKGTDRSAPRSLLRNSLETARMPTGKKINEQ